MQDFNGKVVFVAGGGSGIGLGVAAAFAEQGAQVAVADIDEPSARAAADQLATAHGAQAIGLGLDVSDPAAWISAVDAAERALGPIDVLCNSAGLLGAARPLVDIPPARLQRLFDVTVFGVIHGVQCVAPRMRGRGGHIVTISSIGALDPVPSLADYCAAKAALVAMSQCLAAELAPDGIGVSVVCPGRVNTRLAETTARLMGEPAPALPPAVRNLEPIEVGRMVREAVREGRLYVFTHADSRPRVESRFADILQGFAPLAAQG